MTDPQQFRKKPVVIEAMRVTDYFAARDIAKWMAAGGVIGRPHITRGGEAALDVMTLEGTMRADKGDWVIKGVQGEFYPCKPDIFEATYELVIDDEAEPVTLRCNRPGVHGSHNWHTNGEFVAWCPGAGRIPEEVSRG